MILTPRKLCRAGASVTSAVGPGFGSDGWGRVVTSRTAASGAPLSALDPIAAAFAEHVERADTGERAAASGRA